jgi:hypothetical protein
MRSTPEGDLRATLRKGLLEIKAEAKNIYDKNPKVRKASLQRLNRCGFQTCDIREIYPLKK